MGRKTVASNTLCMIFLEFGYSLRVRSASNGRFGITRDRLR